MFVETEDKRLISALNWGFTVKRNEQLVKKGILKSYTLLHLPHIATTMKLVRVISYLKKDQIYMNHVTHILSSTDISIFHQKLATFVISRNTDIDCILIYNF